MLTVELALRIRERGLALPCGGEFETPRLKEIALRQHELFIELAQLDAELRGMKRGQEETAPVD